MQHSAPAAHNLVQQQALVSPFRTKVVRGKAPPQKALVDPVIASKFAKSSNIVVMPLS
jgi:hypothetical protein